MGTVLTRDDIFAIDDRKIEWCPVPEWSSEEKPDMGVFVMGLSGTDRDSFEMAMIEQRKIGKGKTTQELNLKNLRAKLIVRTAVDGEDPNTAKTVFTLQDIEALGKKNGAALQHIYAVAQKLSGLTNEDVDELTADLGEGQSGASGSDSPLLLDIEASPNVNVGSAPTSSASGSPSTGLSSLATDA